MNKQKIPQLRFPGFSGEWEDKRLGDVAEINPSYQKLPEEFIYIDLESVISGMLLKHNSVNLNEAPSRAQRLLKDEDILFQMVRPYQRNNLFFKSELTNKPTVASTGYAQIRPQGNPKYLYHHLHTDLFVTKVLDRCTGTSYPAINSSDLKAIKVAIPTLPEQQKIADFLSDIETKIKKLSRKKELMTEYKKGVMQKIFSQEIRFKDENGNDYPDWQEKKIEDVFTVTRGYVLAVGKMKQEANSLYIYPVYSSQTQNNGLTGYYKEYLYENSITWTTDGANAGDVKFRKGKFYCTNVCGVLLSKEGNANQCIAEMLNRVSQRYVSYVGNPKLMNNVMAKIKIKFPSVAEQKKISDFLVDLDFKIEQIDKELAVLKEFKKGLLQKMFV